MSDKWEGWEDEYPVESREELLHFYIEGTIISLARIGVRWEGNPRTLYRLTTGGLFASASIWIDTLENGVSAVNRTCRLLGDNSERESLGEGRRRLIVKKLPGFVFQEAREEKEAVCG